LSRHYFRYYRACCCHYCPDYRAFDGRLTQQSKTQLQVSAHDSSRCCCCCCCRCVVIIIFINGKPIIFQLYSPLDTNCLICVCQAKLNRGRRHVTPPAPTTHFTAPGNPQLALVGLSFGLASFRVPFAYVSQDLQYVIRICSYRLAHKVFLFNSSGPFRDFLKIFLS